MVCILFRYSTWNSNFDSIHWKSFSIEMKMNTFNWNQMFSRFWMLQLQAMQRTYSIMHIYRIWLFIWIGLVWFMFFGLLDYVKFGCSYQFWCSHQFGVLYQFVLYQFVLYLSVLYQFGFLHQSKICISNELNEELPQEFHHSYAAE